MRRLKEESEQEKEPHRRICIREERMKSRYLTEVLFLDILEKFVQKTSLLSE